MRSPHWPFREDVRELYQVALNEHGGDADVNDMIFTFERLADVKVTP